MTLQVPKRVVVLSAKLWTVAFASWDMYLTKQLGSNSRLTKRHETKEPAGYIHCSKENNAFLLVRDRLKAPV